MTQTELLSEVKTHGIGLSVVDGRLRIEAPRGTLTPELKNELTLHKGEIIEALKTTYPAPDTKVDDDVVALAQREFKRLARRLSRIMRPGYLKWTAENQPELYREIGQAYEAFDTAERVESLKAGRIAWRDYRRLMLAWGRLHVKAIKLHRLALKERKAA